MSKKAKKGGQSKTQSKPQQKTETATATKMEPSKQQEMNRILQAITNMSLDDPDFIDLKPFEQGKQILLNAIEDLNFYTALYNKGDLSKFPAPVPEEKPPVASK